MHVMHRDALAFTEYEIVVIARDGQNNFPVFCCAVGFYDGDDPNPEIVLHTDENGSATYIRDEPFGEDGWRAGYDANYCSLTDPNNLNIMTDQVEEDEAVTLVTFRPWLD